jgi:hypothetical protein
MKKLIEFLHRKAVKFNTRMELYGSLRVLRECDFLLDQNQKLFIVKNIEKLRENLK